jgi:hypothetical protein
VEGVEIASHQCCLPPMRYSKGRYDQKVQVLETTK